jgi:hypothetical protein
MEVVRQNLGHADVKTSQDYIAVLDGSTHALDRIHELSTWISEDLRTCFTTTSLRPFQALLAPRASAADRCWSCG